MTVEDARKIISLYKEAELLSYAQMANDADICDQTIRNFLKGSTPAHRNWVKIRQYAYRICNDYKIGEDVM